jgi:hypothetical protein
MKQWICIVCPEDTAEQFCLKWGVKWLKGKLEYEGDIEECYLFPLPETVEEFLKEVE